MPRFRSIFEFLLDTNVVSEWVRPAPAEPVVSWLHNADEDRLYLSVITFAEIRRGIGMMPEGAKRERLDVWLKDDLLSRFDGRILSVSPAIALHWGVMMTQGRTTGRSIGTMDAFIAVTAFAHELTLVTRNVADFSGRGIEVFDPWAPV